MYIREDNPLNLPPKSSVRTGACTRPREQDSKAWDQMRKPAFTAQFSKPEQCLHTHHVKQRDSVRSQFCWRRLVHQSKTAQVLSCWANRWVTATPEAGQSRQRALSTLTDTGGRHTVKICNRTQLCAITCHNNIYDNPDENQDETYCLPGIYVSSVSMGPST